MTEMTKKWQKLWDDGKYKTVENSLSLRALLDLSAFYSITEDAWREYVSAIISKLGRANRNTSLLEIGCGAGAFLRAIESKHELWGVDFSEQQIKICRQALPAGYFTVCEACYIDFDSGFFDIVISNSVFQYFPTTDYATTVLQKMLVLLKKNGAGAVLDVADIQYKDAYIEAKRNALGEEAYRQFPSQLYYSRELFIEFSETNGLVYSIEPQAIAGYSNTPFRFNFFFRAEK